MKVLGLVPARGGSVEIPRKNLLRIGGRSLVEWTALSALSSQLDRVVLSSDDLEICSEGLASGLEVPFQRPAHLASSDARSIDVVAHALVELGDYSASLDAVMLLQPTSPFRTSTDINSAIEALKDCDSVISVTELSGAHPARMEYVREGFLEKVPWAGGEDGLPRQRLTSVYVRNGAIYLTRMATLREATFRGKLTRALIMPPERSVNIDSEFDLKVARLLVEQPSNQSSWQRRHHRT